MKKVLYFSIIICILTALFMIPSFAGDSENVDPERTIIFIDGEIYFDKTKDLYRFPMPNRDAGVYANVMDGMITTDKVILQIPDDDNVAVFRNGKDYQLEDNSVSQVGNYMVCYNDSGNLIQVFTFKIVNSVTGKLENYRMPSNFAVDSVTCDENEVEIDRLNVDFSEEGLYCIDYSCIPTGIKYKLKVMIDHTPPTLKLAAVKNGSANGPVDISDLEKGAKIIVKRNGKEVNEYPKLTKSGNYEVTVTDAAGNSSNYLFTIQVYFNINSIVLFIIIIVGILGLLFYIYKTRSNLKVR